MEDEFIKDLARKYANVCEFKSNFPHDWNSVNDGFIEGFKTAVRLIESSALDETSNEKSGLHKHIVNESLPSVPCECGKNFNPYFDGGPCWECETGSVR